ncbi:LysR family transcriptional regulator [Morganella morganii]
MAVDLNLLPVFLAVAEQGSFTGAATGWVCRHPMSAGPSDSWKPRPAAA